MSPAGQISIQLPPIGGWMSCCHTSCHHLDDQRVHFHSDHGMEGSWRNFEWTSYMNSFYNTHWHCSGSKWACCEFKPLQISNGFRAQLLFLLELVLHILIDFEEVEVQCSIMSCGTAINRGRVCHDWSQEVYKLQRRDNTAKLGRQRLRLSNVLDQKSVAGFHLEI